MLKGQYLEFQEKACEEDVPSREIKTDIPRSPSICAQRKNKITEKRNIVKSNLKTQAFKMTRLARVKIRVPEIDCGRCDSRNVLRVMMKADLTKDLYKVGSKDGILNSWYARNQFGTCIEGTVNIPAVPSVNISLRECAGKASLFGGQG